MLESLFSDPFIFLISLVALLVAITVHEFAHAWASDQLGDPTAKLQGRLTLNPLAHLDPIGTLALLLFSFGWGKPVPIDPYNLKEPRRDSALISLAGPASNLILATVLALLLRLPLILPDFIFVPIITLNVMLGIFNLLPFHPLDGGKILVGFLPSSVAQEWDETLNQYGLIILIFFLFPIFGNRSLVSTVILPIIHFILSLLLLPVVLPTNSLI